MSVEGRDVDFALPDGDAAIDFVATGALIHAHVVVRIVGPELFPGLRVERVDLADRTGRVHHAINNDGRGFEAANRVGVVIPGEAEAVNRFRVDLRERRVMTLAEIAPGGKPFAGMLIGGHQALLINLAASSWVLFIGERRQVVLIVDR